MTQETTAHRRADIIQGILAQWQDQGGALLPILHAVQHALGHVPDDAVPPIAQALNLSRAEVHGVLSYYSHFRKTPATRHTVQICRAEACQSVGGHALWQHACTQLEGQPDVTLEPVYCLGLCATAPALSIDERLHARVQPAKLDQLLNTLREAT